MPGRHTLWSSHTLTGTVITSQETRRSDAVRIRPWSAKTASQSWISMASRVGLIRWFRSILEAGFSRSPGLRATTNACLSLLLVGMDVTIVNVALPSIRRDLNVSLSGLQWTIDAYVLVLASLLMLAGSTADRLGRRRIFQTGLVIFTVGSLLCSLAPGLGWLVAFRMVQAVGASMLNPVAMSIITLSLIHI